jgi:general nucleoside transport system ATP-binding protein
MRYTLLRMGSPQEHAPSPGNGTRADSAAEVPHINMRGITKAFGATVANSDVALEVRPGEIHALLGENGAGKTTLMNVLFGMIKPDAGAVVLDEEVTDFSGPHDALERGIGMVHQHFMLVQNFTVAENVVLGAVSPWNLSLRPKKVEAEVAAAAERLQFDIDPRRRIRDLPIDTQQRVEIFKLLYRGARVLILDEPTSSLGPAQIEDLFASLNALRAGGRSIVIVTHKLSEVMEIADRVTILRGGRNVATAEKGSYDERDLARMMTGHELHEVTATGTSYEGKEPIYRVKDLVVDAGTRLNAVHGISFDVRPGEIVGVAGVEGNGQRELVDALTGVADIQGGQIELDGRDITSASVLELRKSGVSGIPEDRQGWGLVLDMSVAENLALSDVPSGRFSRRGLLRHNSIRKSARSLLEEYDVRPPDPDLPVMSLSGGNQQKVVIAREMSREHRVLIAANPTQGVDVGATEYVHRRLLEDRAEGKAIVLVSIDLDELLSLSDRIIVLYRGKIAYQATSDQVSVEAIAMAMAGTPGEGAELNGGAEPAVTAEAG